MANRRDLLQQSGSGRDPLPAEIAVSSQVISICKIINVLLQNIPLVVYTELIDLFKVGWYSNNFIIENKQLWASKRNQRKVIHDSMFSSDLHFEDSHYKISFNHFLLAYR